MKELLELLTVDNDWLLRRHLWTYPAIQGRAGILLLGVSFRWCATIDSQVPCYSSISRVTSPKGFTAPHVPEPTWTRWFPSCYWWFLWPTDVCLFAGNDQGCGCLRSLVSFPLNRDQTYYVLGRHGFRTSASGSYFLERSARNVAGRRYARAWWRLSIDDLGGCEMGCGRTWLAPMFRLVWKPFVVWTLVNWALCGTSFCRQYSGWRSPVYLLVSCGKR